MQLLGGVASESRSLTVESARAERRVQAVGKLGKKHPRKGSLLSGRTAVGRRYDIGRGYATS